MGGNNDVVVSTSAARLPTPSDGRTGRGTTPTTIRKRRRRFANDDDDDGGRSTRSIMPHLPLLVQAYRNIPCSSGTRLQLSVGTTRVRCCHSRRLPPTSFFQPCGRLPSSTFLSRRRPLPYLSDPVRRGPPTSWRALSTGRRGRRAEPGVPSHINVAFPFVIVISVFFFLLFVVVVAFVVIVVVIVDVPYDANATHRSTTTRRCRTCPSCRGISRPTTAIIVRRSCRLRCASPLSMRCCRCVVVANHQSSSMDGTMDDAPSEKILTENLAHIHYSLT